MKQKLTHILPSLAVGGLLLTAGTLAGLSGAAFIHAVVPGLHKTTVSREIKRMADDLGYRADVARALQAMLDCDAGWAVNHLTRLALTVPGPGGAA